MRFLLYPVVVKAHLRSKEVKAKLYKYHNSRVNTCIKFILAIEIHLIIARVLLIFVEVKGYKRTKFEELVSINSIREA